MHMWSAQRISTPRAIVETYRLFCPGPAQAFAIPIAYSCELHVRGRQHSLVQPNLPGRCLLQAGAVWSRSRVALLESPGGSGWCHCPRHPLSPPLISETPLSGRPRFIVEVVAADGVDNRTGRSRRLQTQLEGRRRRQSDRYAHPHGTPGTASSPSLSQEFRSTGCRFSLRGLYRILATIQGQDTQLQDR